MELDDFRAQLENDLVWRRSELSVLKSVARTAPDQTTQDTVVKTLILMLYASFEGFCKFGLKLYLEYVMAVLPSNRDLRHHLQALSVFPSVKSLWKVGEKDPELARLPPFLSNQHTWERELFRVNPDEWIRSGNLNAKELSRLLVMVGIDPSVVVSYEPSLHNLLARRTVIAHGEAGQRPLTLADYLHLETEVYQAQGDILRSIYSAASDWSFLVTA